MATLTKTNRRDFLKIAGTTAGGLFIGFNWMSCDSPKMEVLSTEEVLANAKNFNAFLSIAPSGDVRRTLNWDRISRHPSQWSLPKNWMQIGTK